MITSGRNNPPNRVGHADVWHAVLESSHASLEDKEEARRQLQSLADSGDREAGEKISAIRSKPASVWAKFITDHLGRQDFSEVTLADLLEHVSHFGIRTDLILELRERLTC